MSLNLPDFRKVIKDQDLNTEADSRSLNPPKDLQKVEIVAKDGVTSSELQRVLVNPQAITETKAANWAKKYIPGKSDPVLQWINGTEKVISFSAIVTKDLAENNTVRYISGYQNKLITNGSIEQTGNLELTSGNINSYEASIIKGLFSRYAQSNEPLSIPGSATTQDSLGVLAGRASSVANNKYWPISIANHLEYYRSLVLPRTSNRNQSKPPPLVGLRMGDILSNRDQDTDWILLQYNFNITKFNPELVPIEAEVQFTFIEYVSETKQVDPEFYRERAIDSSIEDEISKFRATPLDELIQPSTSNQNLDPNGTIA